MSQPQLTFNSVFFRSMLNVTWLSSPLLPRLLAECESQKDWVVRAQACCLETLFIRQSRRPQ